MNLEISGRHALVCAASKGLGKACAMALALEGVNVTINARNREALESAAVEIQQAAGMLVNTVACDITTRDGQDAILRLYHRPEPAAGRRFLCRDLRLKCGVAKLRR